MNGYHNIRDASKASVPDGILSQLLKACCLEIAPSVIELFSHSLQSRRIPFE